MVKKPTYEELEQNIKDFEKEVVACNQVEEKLRQSEKRFQTLALAANEIVWHADARGNPIGENMSWRQFTGQTLEEITGGHWLDAVHPKDQAVVGVAFTSAMAERRPYRVENRLRRFDGTWRYIVANGVPILEADGTIREWVGVCQDITERKQAEEALKIANDELVKESFQRKLLSKKLVDLLENDRRQIAMELHDHIGQTLTSLKIGLEIALKKLEPGHTEMQDQIISAQERTVQALKDIKDISRGLRPAMLDAMGLEPSLRELFSDIQIKTDIQILFFNRNVPKRFDHEKELALYRIAPESLTNIIKHANAKNIFVNLLKKGKVLSFSVEDDGVGFKQDGAMQISKKKGPLGLFIMRERVSQFGGEFTIETQPGKGAHVLAEIPL